MSNLFQKYVAPYLTLKSSSPSKDDVIIADGFERLERELNMKKYYGSMTTRRCNEIKQEMKLMCNSTITASTKKEVMTSVATNINSIYPRSLDFLNMVDACIRKYS